MYRYQNGARVRFPHAVLVHVVAARYGQTPEQVREWPADDFRVACGLLELTA